MPMCYSPFAICSPMTGHTVDTDLFFPVASQTLAHGQSIRLGFLHCFDRAVTGLTLDPGSNMGPMFKKHKICHGGDLGPLDGLFLIPVILKFLYFRFVRRSNLMTTHAALHRRNPGHCSAPGVAMAVLAGNLVFSRVNLVAKSNRLLLAFRAAGGRQKNGAYKKN